MPKHEKRNQFKFERKEVPYYEHGICSDVGYLKLKTSLIARRNGQSKIFTAPFAKGQSIQIVLEDWDKTLSSIAERWPSLYEFENDLAKKVGPLSVQKPLSQRLEDIDHYYADISLPQVPVADSAIESVIGDFTPLRGMHIRNQFETAKKMKKSSSAGLPIMGKRRDSLWDSIPASLNCYLTNPPSVEAAVKNYKKYAFSEQTYGAYDMCAVLGWRGQEGGLDADDVKQRVIWMFPEAVNLCELQVYQPLIEASQKHNIIPAWVSMDSVDREITQLFDTKSPDELVICTDFSKFDQHFNETLQTAAYKVLNSILYANSESDRWLKEVFPTKYNIPLVIDVVDDTDDLVILMGKHGMASGSGGTNADETLAHKCLQHEVAQKHGQTLNPHSMCLGDDGILTYPGITVDDVVESYSSHGQECNAEKQYASTQDCVYLRRWHHEDYRENGICVGVYSTNRALGKLRYLERFMNPEVWTPIMVALRQLSIIENCNHHPLFEEFVQFCMKRDKYRLGLDIPGFLQNIDDYAEKAIENMPDFMGYTKTLQSEGKPLGLSSWRVVRYLKSLS